jgi:phage shock protein A
MAVKKILLGTAAVVVCGGLVLGPARMWSHLTTMKKSAEEAVAELTSDAHEAGRIRTLIADFDGKIVEFDLKVVGIREDVADADARVSALRREIDAERGILTRSQVLLDDAAKDEHEIGGRVYARVEVEADARTRLLRAKELERRLVLEEALTKQLRDAMGQGEENLVAARSKRHELTIQLEALEARLVSARVRSEVGDLTRELRESPIGPQTELGSSIKEFEARVRRLERKADLLATSQRATVVDWTPRDTSMSASDAIAAYLATTMSEDVSEETAKVAPSSSASPSAVEIPSQVTTPTESTSIVESR